MSLRLKPRTSARYFGNHVMYSHQTGSVTNRATTSAHVCRYFRSSRQATAPAFACRLRRGRLLDQRALCRGDRRMAIRALVEQEPQHQPAESETAGDEKRRLPPVVDLQKDEERRRDDVAHGDAAVEDAHRQRSLARREPLRDDFRRARPVAGFAQTEDESQDAQIAQASRKRVRGRGHRPHEHREREPSPRADTIVEAARQTLAGRVRREEPDREAGEFRVGEAEVRRDHRTKHGDREPIDEVDEGREKNEPDDPPSQAAHCRH